MPIYDKPSWQLLKQALADLPDPFTTDEVFAWFEANYPKVKRGTQMACLTGMSVNNPTRRYHPNLQSQGILYKIDKNHYTRYDPERHGAFDQLGRQLGIADGTQEAPSEGLEGGSASDEITPEQAEFALEIHLEEFMERNWDRIDFGRPLEIWVDEEGVRGRQYMTGIGTIDFLCRDRESGAFVVIELKKGRTSDQVVGQCLRYMGWVKKNLAPNGAEIFGLIVAGDVDEKLRYAMEVAPHVSARRYRVRFELVTSEETGA